MFSGIASVTLSAFSYATTFTTTLFLTGKCPHSNHKIQAFTEGPCYPLYFFAKTSAITPRNFIGCNYVDDMVFGCTYNAESTLSHLLVNLTKLTWCSSSHSKILNALKSVDVPFNPQPVFNYSSIYSDLAPAAFIKEYIRKDSSVRCSRIDRTKNFCEPSMLNLCSPN